MELLSLPDMPLTELERERKKNLLYYWFKESDNRIHDLRVNRISGKNPKKERTTETVLINLSQITEP